MKYKLFAADDINIITNQINDFIKTMEIDDIDILNDGVMFSDGKYMFYIRYEDNDE